MKPRFIVIPLDGLSRDEMNSLLRMCPTSADRTATALDLMRRLIEDEMQDQVAQEKAA